MPLINSGSKAAVSENIKREMASGKPAPGGRDRPLGEAEGAELPDQGQGEEVMSALIPNPSQADYEHQALVDYDLAHASRDRIADVRAWIRRAVAAEEANGAMLAALRIARPYVGRCNGVDAANAGNLAKIDAALALGEKR